MIKLLKRILLKLISILNKIQNRRNNKLKEKVISNNKSTKYIAMGNSNISHDSLIGDYTYIGFNCFITKATIGRYCSIANNVSIGMGEHKIKRVSTSSLFYKKPYETLTDKNCIIGNDVWLGQNVVIRRGVKIGDGAVIGANSFVNKNVEQFTVVAGSPAKYIVKRFDEKKIKAIIETEWWNREIGEAKKIINTLTNKFDFEKDDK